MGNFLYFIDSGESIDSSGLTHLKTGDWTRRDCRIGPGGKAGCVLSRDGCGYFAEQQTWRQFGKVWIGFATNERPTHESLFRQPGDLQTVPVKLQDGKTWQVCKVREWVTQEGQLRYHDKLPRLLDLDESGRMKAIGDIVVNYRKLWELSTQAVPVFLGEVVTEELDDAASNTVIESFRLLYGMTEKELALMQLLHPASLGECLRKILDIDTFFDLLKNVTSRSESSTPIGSDGAERQTRDANITTGQLAANC